LFFAGRRQLLQYIVGCALPEDVTLTVELKGRAYAFSGGSGLAPAWTERGLTLAEQRWVSACVFARTNHFGKQVVISLRSSAPAAKSLHAPKTERRDFSLFEGGFFGNLFQERPVAYACTGDRSPERAADPILEDRVCTERSGASSPSGAPLTRCGFILTGSCDDPRSFRVGDQVFREVIYTYLKPVVAKP
jgi:hypothetical protein